MSPVYLFIACLSMLVSSAIAQADTTYAERLGFPRGKKVIVLHVDDAGMSYEANQGTRRAIDEGIAVSTSVMMPCAWVPDFMAYARQKPTLDVGVHLTLTSEWKGYRWSPLTGQKTGLCDAQGAFWPSVQEVVDQATPAEVDAEIRAQLARFRSFGIEPTHLDSHMGTLFDLKFMPTYVKLGIEQQIPLLFPGGHATLIVAANNIPQEQRVIARKVGRQLWDAGLPVFDDLDGSSYSWNLPAGMPVTDKALQRMKTEKYIDLLKRCQPGLTYVIMHCAQNSPQFSQITSSWPTRQGDLLAMLDPELKAYIQREGIIVTTCRELMARRKQAGR
ncbi:polysaccharide deacetylase family protein [Fibrivirga algicola]|uniref:ChbG/HpnK family deacetylase n=1 Tax=Fibrivirga algicola TaxID=2950420 RepID=A0ABX0QEY5_9BACT|nr:polysaccharide deacetylase family protein [Fibrivirga algicola]NID09780.1 ChbG/HpnK family deacetylase [Fibrivirga algicola]